MVPGPAGGCQAGHHLAKIICDGGALAQSLRRVIRISVLGQDGESTHEEGSRPMGLTNALYKAARLSATGRAARKGPAALGKRVVRRAVYRGEGKTTRKVFRMFGL